MKAQISVTYKGKTVNAATVSDFTKVKREYTHTILFDGPRGGRHLAVVMRSGKVMVCSPNVTFSSEWKFFGEAIVTGL